MQGRNNGIAIPVFGKIQKKQALLFGTAGFLLFLFFILLFLQASQIEALKQEKAVISAEKYALDLNFTEFRAKSAERVSSLERLNNAKAKEITELKEKIASVEGLLAGLEKDYNELKQAKKTLGEEYALLKEESAQTIKSIEEFEGEIESSIEWFQENAALHDTERQTLAKTSLESRCFLVSGQGCSVKTACLYLVNSMQEYLGLSYIADKGDRLTPVSEFLDKKGGDCEDFSLFFKAELNHFLEKCGNARPETISVEAWTGAESLVARYWIDNQNQWYLEGVQKQSLEAGYVFPAVVCGNIYDLQKKEIAGHCVVALTKKRISGIADVFNELDGAPLIEPQDGSFLGNINEASSLVYLNKEGDSTKHDSFIYWVITDNDFYMFDQESAEWTGYAFFAEKLAALKEKLALLAE
ncbi:MAG: hypothetical protein NT067_05835 [Candidatus Diapherotrites archaeon]|nr:hypothetical protein [Candidatus Diapherotrites archaeon]